MFYLFLGIKVLKYDNIIYTRKSLNSLQLLISQATNGIIVNSIYLENDQQFELLVFDDFEFMNPISITVPKSMSGLPPKLVTGPIYNLVIFYDDYSRLSLDHVNTIFSFII